MKSTVNQRLAEFIKKIGISNVQFGTIIGESKYSINNWFNKETKIPVSTLSDILIAYPELDARWLMTGEGKILYEVGKGSENNNQFQVSEPSSKYGKCELCEEKDKRIAVLEKYIERLEFDLGKKIQTA